MNTAQSSNGPLPVVDSIQRVTNTLIQTAYNYFGQMPVAWGRYTTTQGEAEYSHALENGPLAAHNIRFLPIARHTTHVGGSAALGAQDAQQGINDLFATFDIAYLQAQGGEFLYFLDVEGNKPGQGNSPSISYDYYSAWSDTIQQFSLQKSSNAVKILPCVYANEHDDTTFGILTDAAKPVICHGLWIARYYLDLDKQIPSGEKMPGWSESFAVPQMIQNSPIPVFLRQYAAGNQHQVNQPFDLDQTNPNIHNLQSDFLDKLILPPVHS